MSPKYITFFVSAVVITITMAGFVVWVRQKNPSPGIRTKTRAVVAFLVATVVLGTSMTMFGRFFGANSPLVAAIATMVIMGWTAFANDVVPMRLPNALREIRKWELSRFPYRTLGVSAFGRILRRSPLRHLNPAVYLNGPSISSEFVRVHLEIAEVVHFWAMVVSVPYLILAILNGWLQAVSAILLVHLLANVYPLCHLRLARGRIARYQRRSG